jgi:hypothetical protein
MALSREEKEDIVNRVVEILRSPDKQALIEALRQRVTAQSEQSKVEDVQYDEIVYSVLTAIEELYQ